MDQKRLFLKKLVWVAPAVVAIVHVRPRAQQISAHGSYDPNDKEIIETAQE